MEFNTSPERIQAAYDLARESGDGNEVLAGYYLLGLSDDNFAKFTDPETDIDEVESILDNVAEAFRNYGIEE